MYCGTLTFWQRGLWDSQCFFSVLGEWWRAFQKGKISVRRGKKGKTIKLTQ